MPEPRAVREPVDVAVVGAGGAGLAAAVSAAEHGATVVVMEQRPVPGGKTAIAMGSLTASGTAAQRRLGIEDTNEAHRHDLEALLRRSATPFTVSDPSVDIVIEGGAPALDWLEGHGLAFSGPHPERPHRAYRLHCAIPDGSAYARALGAALAALGGRVRCDARVVDVRVDENDVLLIRLAGGDEAVRARTIILAAGDYSGGIERFRPGWASAIEPLTPWSQGDAHELALRLGADLAGMDAPISAQLRFLDPPFTAPDLALLKLGATVVDESGARPEATWPDAGFFKATAAGRWYLVFGDEVAEHLAEASSDREGSRDGWLRTGRHAISTAPGRGYDYLDDVLTRGGCVSAGSVPELGEQAGIRTEGLCATIDALNSGRSDAQPPWPIRRAPLVALGPLRSRIPLADGGVRVDADMRALDADGRPVPGIYAAGQSAAWFGQVEGHGYPIAWAIASGRRAGRAAALRR